MISRLSVPDGIDVGNRPERNHGDFPHFQGFASQRT
jgi:hypothetical protein